VPEAYTMKTSFAASAGVYGGGRWQAGEGESLTVVNPWCCSTACRISCRGARIRA
jgi:hypothetical protein